MNGIEAVIATQVLDATAVGVALMTAVDAAAARSTIAAVPTARTLTINGTAFDLSADRSWTVSGGISSLNGLTDATQTFQTGTTGTDFAIVSAAGVHTLNLPDASVAARGVVTTGTQTFAGTKTFNGDVRINGTLDFNANNYFNYRLVIGFAAGASRLTFHSINANGSGWGTINSINGWSDGTSWWCKVGGGAWGFGTGVYSFTHGFYSPTANTTRLIGGVNSQVFSVSNTYTSDTSFERLALQFVTYLSARYAQLACESAGTGIANMNLVLSPKGTGALIAGPVPDGTATGGNTRGANAVDLQTSRSSATQVAASIADFQAGANNTTNAGYAATFGQTNTNTGAYGFVSGQNNTNSATWGGTFGGFFSVASAFGAVTLGGIQANAYRRCMRAFAANAFSSLTPGDCQGAEVVLQGITTTNTPVELLISQNTRLTVPSGIVCHFLFIVTGVRQGGADVAYYMRRATVKNIGGTVSLVGSVDTIGTDVATGTSLSITADNTNKAISVAPTGVLSQNWRWNCIVYGGELGHA